MIIPCSSTDRTLSGSLCDEWPSTRITDPAAITHTSTVICDLFPEVRQCTFLVPFVPQPLVVYDLKALQIHPYCKFCWGIP